MGEVNRGDLVSASSLDDISPSMQETSFQNYLYGPCRTHLLDTLVSFPTHHVIPVSLTISSSYDEPHPFMVTVIVTCCSKLEMRHLSHMHSIKP